MDFYHSWLYIYIFNTKYFVWTIVIVIGLLNLLSPILLWFVFNGKQIWKGKKEKGNSKN